MNNLSPLFEVPANSSRFFDNYIEVISQPLGNVQLAWDPNDEIIVNQKYRPELIKYDTQYCTSVSEIGNQYEIPTLSYIDEILQFLKEKPVVIDIGCGQGEFVSELRKREIDAWGYDPVVRLDNPFLYSRYWVPEEKSADLYVMRCVLPHIRSPWDFLREISISAPQSLVLIEFQRVEWIFEHKVWYQVSHDHVNLFSISSFTSRYEVIKSGTFLNGEWGWVLIDPSEKENLVHNSPPNHYREISSLFTEKERFTKAMEEYDRPISIWGAAGKGIVLAHALIRFNNDLFLIDADPSRWGRFLEASGLKVFPPIEALKNFPSGTLILVCNPNHLEQVKEYVQDKLQVKLPAQI
jgi:hypothetical protein